MIPTNEIPPIALASPSLHSSTKTSVFQGLSTPSAVPPSTNSLATIQPINLILKEPEKYLGNQITVEGILEADGQIPDLRFYLRAPENERLEVSPWAPLEVMHPPKGEAKTKSMAYYVELHLRLTGVLQIEEGGLILEVTSVEEVQP